MPKCQGDCPELRGKLATLDGPRLRNLHIFGNALLRNDIRQRGQEGGDLAITLHFAELTFGHQQTRADPALDDRG